MNFNSQICTTKEQSERLLTLGLRPETADCAHCYTSEEHGEYKFWDIVISDWEPYWDVDDENIPAWSLHRLLYIIPNEYFTDIDFQDIMQRCIFATSTLYNDLIDLIEALIKEGYIYSEYLK